MKNEIVIGHLGDHTFILAAVGSKFEIRIRNTDGDIDPTPAIHFGKTVHDYVDADEDRTLLDYDWMHRDYLQAELIQDAIRAWSEWCDTESASDELLSQLSDICMEHWDVQDECEKMIRLWNQHEREARSNNARHDI